MGGTNDGRELIIGRATGSLPPRRLRHRREALLCAAATAAVALSLANPPRAEASPTFDIVEMLDVVPGTTTVLNPDTGLQELVTQILSPPGVNPPNIVLTADNNVIVLYADAVGDTVELTRYDATTKKNVTYDYTVTKVYTNASYNDVYKVQLELVGSNPAVYKTLDLVTSTTPTTINSGGPGSGVQDKSPAPTAGTKRVIKQGAPGGDGNAGVGVSFGLFTIEYAPGDGGAGSPGPNLNYSGANALHGDYNSNLANTPAIQIISIGGTGGDGGASIGNIPAGNGGPAGVGGNVSVTAYGTIATHQDNSPGLWVESQGGHGGSGGGALFLGSGGGGGGATRGGDVYVDLTTTGQIHTYGNASPGILAESLGGSGGNGGFSVGIVGTAGDASYGGDGGNVRVHQNGVVITEGNFSYGVLAESIGGNGGDAGSSYAIASLGDQGAGGGNGALAAIYAGAHSITITHGDYAIGLFAESVGGGGGNGGSSTALVTLGTYGAGGGNGGEAKVVLGAGAYVYTRGNASVGVEAESIGGGGGSGGSSLALAALGSSGAGGGNASLAVVYSSGEIVTEGNNAMGVLVQSIGGGGGSSGAADGVVALGGTGSVGGYGAEALVKLYAGSEIFTHGYGSDGVVAQSIGGGGGVGSSSGGLVALGASGGGGGNGGKVGVYNYGLISTTGDQSRGIFAESIGGGGGHGGDSGGLAAVGGNATTGGTGGDVVVTNDGEIFTGGNMSAGIEAQSIGGGGGDGGNSGGVVLAVGGTAGSGGGSAYNGGSGVVTVNDSGFIETGGNDSDGIFAQSVGGGGGNGGSATSVSAFVGVAIGGQGGNGGAGGNVYVNLSPGTVTLGNTAVTGDPQIITTGDRSAGIFEESIGGGGGNGGAATQGTIGYIGAISIAIGGAGGDGGDGGNVHLTGDGEIQTHGNNSDGIDIQSVGGGGGTGGFAISVAASGGIIASGAISVGVGGTGGNGGKGGGVYADTGGAIYTEGNFSTGFLAQSVGGGGGAGGFAVSATATGSGGVSGAVSVGVGGNGGKGGDGGLVDVTFDGSITTKGAYATGALIQSVGGGGGSGGFDISAGVTGSAGASGDLAVGIGGSGAYGGMGGTVTGDVSGNVVTYGNHSDGIVVQSVGGGGGAGGFNVSGAIAGSGGGALAVTVGLGGTGAGGGHGGDVYAYGGTVTTHGNYSYGFIAQSVGGGGGSGGFNVSGGIAGAGEGAGAVSVGLGGNAGSGGYGETVHGHVTGPVVTYGNFSGGVVVQSVGGGGGEGGFNVSGALSGAGVGAGSVSVGLGGTGGDGGVGGNVYGYAAAAITTFGNHSNGFLAQSVGGGGGDGGFDVSGGISGAGEGAGAVSVGLGGSGGGGGDAGNVTGNVSGVVVTYGNFSDGVVVQSIGGGGGDGSFNVTGDISGAGQGAGAVSVGIGGGGGKAGDSGTVHAYSVSITTHGDDSTGFLAQSVGGGGGNGGFDVSGSISGAGTGTGTVSVGVGGAGAYGGHGGDVYAGVIGNVTTDGNFSDGIVAQSLGGGGGDGGFNVAGGISGAGEGSGSISVGVGGSGGHGGYAENVTLTVEGMVYTLGNHSDGILAQSVGGGGGSGGFNVTGDVSVAGTGAGTLGVGVGGMGGDGGSGGDVTLNVTGVVLYGETIAAITHGDYSSGVIAQSIGGGGGSGGFNVTGGISGAETGAGNVDIGVGGSGGNASNGGVVIGYVSGDVLTSGKGSQGVLVQSVGGGGGGGGFDVSGGITGAGTGSGNIDVGVGGFGGGGGSGGAVYAGVTGDVQTLGDNASGVTFQSMGGGGGSGGFNVSGGVAITVQSGGGSGNIDVGVGGFGGDGGHSGNVTGSVDGNILTYGDNSHGLLVQSVGGGGGDGGFNVSGGIAGSSGAAGNIDVGLGGFGGNGGYSGNVTGNLTGNVFTYGNTSFGVTIQSVGGGGGDGGFNVTGDVAISLSDTSGAGDIGVGIGGFGGDGGNSGNVTGLITGNVTTHGYDSHGILIQSAAGGGGDGGFNVTGSLAASSASSGSIGVGLGGFGGGAADAGNVYGTITGNVATEGNNSFGVTVQSMGGDGGDGAFNVTGGVAVSLSDATATGTIGVGIGGFGGDGGNAGNVTASMTGDIVTYGADSHGLLIQSAGGGGGSGGFDVTGGISAAANGAGNIDIGLGGFGGSGGNAGDVTGAITGNVETHGYDSFGVSIQSMGGGGGDGGFNVTGSIAADVNSTSGAGDIGVGIGGFGGDGGNAANVHGNVTGNVVTLGDDSHGIMVQSAGGGGGDGAFNVTGALSFSTGSSGNVEFGLGGFGGKGGYAGNVYSDITGDVLTEGNNSFGISIQSMGGGGGDGGFNVTGGIQISTSGSGGAGSIGIGVGGFGGDGGHAGDVTGDVTGDIYTLGADSHGLLIQSAGGGGGDGAFDVTGGISVSTASAGNIDLGLGGFGGNGGYAGNVTGSLTGNVLTYGNNSFGVSIQSMGGGGGDGGFNVTGGMSFSSADSGATANIGVGIGGFGGDGGNAGNVSGTVTGDVTTLGDNAHGIMIQSAGGGGGDGAFNVSGGVAMSNAGSGNLDFGLGGFGGSGGSAGYVYGKVTGDVFTEGDNSFGVSIQSMGGGGGDGGFDITGGIAMNFTGSTGAGDIGIGIGGFGGDGGSAGNVTGFVSGEVVTDGDDSHAVLIQSVGGGGGDGGFNVSGGISLSKGNSGNIEFGLGGFGGGAGDGGTVEGTVTGAVVTHGYDSFGVTIQSQGGGGGDGGLNVTGGIDASILAGGTGASGDIGIGIGGFGAGGGTGGNVYGTVSGTVITYGDSSHGVLIQSAGGGGGDGGLNVTGDIGISSGADGSIGFGLGGFGGYGGTGGNVTGNVTGEVFTYGNHSFGVEIESVGGGGGDGGLDVTGSVSITSGKNTSVAVGLGIGGFGGDGGDGGDVTGSVVGTVVTRGDYSPGVIAASLGGGGGTGGLNVTGDISISTGDSGTVGVGIGGFGGNAGNGGDVYLFRQGDTETNGVQSDGVTAESIGGKGGAGGINVTGGLAISTTNPNGGISIGIGGFGGDGGTGSDVTLIDEGDVFVTGTGNGIVAESVGGGGGNGGINVSGQLDLAPPNDPNSSSNAATIGIGGFGGTGGNAGNVYLTVVGQYTQLATVVANGDNNSAVIAQSVGKGGGNGGINVSGGLSMDGSLTIGIGGGGGGGGTGGNVYATVDANLYADGKNSRGLLVQSIGGGGGNGAIDISGGVSANTVGNEPSVVFGIGGFGGPGSTSGNATAVQYGQVEVSGVDSIGILVQSVAGGGGSGGLNVSADVNDQAATSKTTGIGVAVGVGGSGGDGANSGNATLYSNGFVYVNATGTAAGGTTIPGPTDPASRFNASAGVMVQSIGGGGGVGGIDATGVVTQSGSPMLIGVGGTGGSGGNSGNVTVVRGYNVGAYGVLTANPTEIVTKGDSTDGLVAQSIAGGGGDAGMNFTLGLSNANNTNASAVLINVGGGAGDAGNAGNVTVHDDEGIFTYGVGSTGLLAQSIGGGGGNTNLNIGAGLTRVQNAVTLTIGGGTGDGGDGGNVYVNHTGDIVTHGAAAFGIEAESIGGGGGNTDLDLGVAILSKNQVNITIGRDGGTGGTAGNVYVNSNGIIETYGKDAVGILAQSIGGGGGTSSADSFGVQTTSNSNKDDTAEANLAIGLMGGYGATGGNVTVKVEDEIVTSGQYADGVLAQSIGGGGGKAGSATDPDVLTATSVAVSLGGTGGTGAVAGYVYVDSSAIIVTTGNNADGVMAQSIGGGGGLGGMARQIEADVAGSSNNQTNVSIADSIGGIGGIGADGGNVTVINSGTIVTRGGDAYGIGAQSIGGGGGVGGAVVDLAAVANKSNTSVDINVGGQGGYGGDGAVVKVTNNGLIETYGNNSVGIEAESVGGGGGNAGVILVASLDLNKPSGTKTDNRFTFNLGGEGGVGGTGGDVFVYNEPVTGVQFSGDIVTHGQHAYGILAQSIGGGGGNGSNVFNLLAGTTGKDSVSFSLNVGGNGGQGGDGGNVTVVNGGLIETYGDYAHGIVAESIGGGGGNSGLAASISAQISNAASSLIHAPMITVGGLGGDGGNGGAVTVTNTGEIITEGKNADGILALSIGGGGGNANVGLSLDPNLVSMVLSNSISALIGGVGGGSGGAGGAVTVNQSGDITVLGQGSQAIDAESINGGGGTIDFSLAQLISLPGITAIGANSNTPVPDPMVSAQLGAENASGFTGGGAVVNMTGTIGAAGDDSVGMFEQSIGGGGGTIRFDVTMGNAADTNLYGPVSGVGFSAELGGTDGVHNDGGDIASNQTGMIVTAGAASPGALVQSIGGGGGRAVFDIYAPTGSTVDPITFNLGGTNGSYESGGNISFTHDGMILTGGVLSTGEIIQSIGGGGGDASLFLHGDGADQTAVTVTLGSTGGSNLNGGNIYAAFNGGVITEGAHANGLFIQSIGGGGGDARIYGASSLDVTLGGGSGDGGDVTLVNTGGIYTFGDGSNGVFLQSIGGGGGAVMVGIDPPQVTLSGGGIGNGGDIAFTQTGDIMVMGADSIGIIAQSIGGGGGYVEGAFHGTAGGVGAGGAIDLIIDGKIMALENNSTGVFAESTGSLGGGDITITAGDAIRGGSGSGVGIYVDGGADNLITTTTSLSAVSGNAIVTTFGNDTVDNTGLVVGDIFLGGGVNAFNNELGSTFIAFHTIALQDASAGSSGVFTNSGEFQMGLSAPLAPIDLLNGATFGNLDNDGVDPRFNLLYGARVIETVNLTGNFVQTSTGHLDFDVAFGPYPSDLVNVSGNTTVAGTGNVILTWLQDNHPVTLFATKGTATDNGLQIAPTMAVDFGIIANTIGIQLTIQTNFGQPFLTPNEQRLGHHMDSAVEVGGSAGIGQLLAYLGNMSTSQKALYAAVFDQLNPEPLVSPLRTQMTEANTFGQDLFGCLTTTTTTVDKDCVWVKGDETSERGNAEGGYWGSTMIGNNASGGWQRPLQGAWSIAAAAGYETVTDLSVNKGRARGSGQGGDVGIGFQRRSPDGLALDFGITGGWTSLDMARQVDVIGMLPPGVGRSNIQTGYAQARVDASKLYTSGRWFVRPEVGLTTTLLRTNSFAETGLAGIGVKSDGDTHIQEAAQPDIAFGRVLYDGDKERAELTFKLGGRFSTDNDLFLPMSFIGAGQGARPAFIQTPYDQTAGIASIDLDVWGDGPLSVAIDYTSEFGKASGNQHGSIDFKFKF